MDLLCACCTSVPTAIPITNPMPSEIAVSLSNARLVVIELALSITRLIASLFNFVDTSSDGKSCVELTLRCGQSFAREEHLYDLAAGIFCSIIPGVFLTLYFALLHMRFFVMNIALS